MEAVEVKFKRLHENTTIPKRGSELAGGWDVTVTRIEKKEKGLFICYLGFAMNFPKEYKLTLVPRSSLTKTTYVLQNTPALGDADYTGEYQLRFRGIPTGINDSGLTYDEFPFKEGDRVGQLYLEEVIPIKFIEVSELEETERGSGGYGSTGK